MRTALAAISLIMQAVYTYGLLSLAAYFTWVWSFDYTSIDADPRMMNLAFYNAMFDFTVAMACGLLGIFFAWFVLRLENFRPRWFTAANKATALTWLVFIPLGTIVGFFLLRWCQRDAESLAAT